VVDHARAQIEDSLQRAVDAQVPGKARPVRRAQRIGGRTDAAVDAGDHHLTARGSIGRQWAALGTDDAVDHGEPRVVHPLQLGLCTLDDDGPVRIVRDGRQLTMLARVAGLHKDGERIDRKHAVDAIRQRASVCAAVDDQRLGGADAGPAPQVVDGSPHSRGPMTRHGEAHHPESLRFGAQALDLARHLVGSYHDECLQARWWHAEALPARIGAWDMSRSGSVSRGRSDRCRRVAILGSRPDLGPI
jgi:hypothetical protein